MLRLKTIVLTALCLLVFAITRSQQVSFTGKEVSLEKILRAVEKQTGFLAVYNESLLLTSRPVTIAVKNMPLNEFMTEVLKGQKITFSIRGKTIVLEKKDAEKNGNEELITKITGTVVDLNSQPLAGATIRIKSKNSTAITNELGYFELMGDNGDLLIISYVGFREKKLQYTGGVIKIQLDQLPNQLDTTEVVVMNTGYQQIPKERATGSFEQINARKFNTQISTDILNRLEGMSASILMDKRGTSPSNNVIGGSNIMIRGLSTITESIKSPLIILNNFPYEGDISNINPNDVESVTILKDAAAASIWGARAGNGVIVITTKKGNYRQPTRFSVTSNVKITEKPDLFDLPAMSSTDFIDMEKFLFSQGFYNSDVDPSNTSRPGISPVVEILDQQEKGSITEEKASELIDALRGQDYRNDFSKYVYRTSVSQQYAMNLTGGSQNLRYALSAGYDKVLTSLTGNDNTRITVRSDNTFSPMKNLELDFSVGLTSGNAQNNSLGEIGTEKYNFNSSYPVRTLYPYAVFADAIGLPLAVPHDYRLSYLQTLNVPGLLNWEFKPLNEVRAADNTNRMQDVLLNAGISYKFLNAFNVQVQYQYEKGTSKTENYYSLETYYARNLINLYSNWNGSVLVNRIPRGGILITNPRELTAHAVRAQLNYSKTFGGMHQVVALAGAEQREKVGRFESNTLYGFNKESNSSARVNADTLYSLFQGLGNAVGRVPYLQQIGALTDRFVSFFANASYIFDNRLTLSASARRDASNLFGVETNNKWKPLWSVGASWELSNEHFYRLDLFPFLKLRATYGTRGNVNNSLTRYATISRSPATWNLINVPYATLNAPADPSLRWETVSEFNLGLDFRTRGSRIFGSLEWYSKLSDNLVTNSLVDPVTGLEAVRKNSASLITRGVQIHLNSVNLTGPVKWTSELAFNYTGTKVKDYMLEDKGRNISAISGNNSTIIIVRNKDPYGIFSLPFAGLDPENGDPRGYLDGKISKDYFNILQQTIDTADIVYHGSGLPLYYGFLNNTFSWKGFSLAVNLLYQFDFYFRRNALSYESLFNLGVTYPGYSERWKQKGDELVTNVPSQAYPSDPYRDEFYRNSSVNVLKGDNIRLQYIRLSYDLIKPVFGWEGIQNIQLSVIGSDLGFLWRANKERLDPALGGTDFRYPVPKSLALGLKITF